MGPPRVLVSPYLGIKNVIVILHAQTCHFFVSFRYFSSKKIYVACALSTRIRCSPHFFGNFKNVHLKKLLFLTYFSHFFVTGKRHKNPFSTYPTYIHVFCSPYWPFRFPNLHKSAYSSCMISLWCVSVVLPPFWCNQ